MWNFLMFDQREKLLLKVSFLRKEPNIFIFYLSYALKPKALSFSFSSSLLFVGQKVNKTILTKSIKKDDK